TEYQVRETAVLNKQLVHEARFSYRRDYSRTTPISDDISIDVLDAFNAGGAQNKSVNDNRTVEFGDLWMYSGGRWSFKTGGQLLRRLNHNENENNFGGTFTFSSLADYLARQPVTFRSTSSMPSTPAALKTKASMTIALSSLATSGCTPAADGVSKPVGSCCAV